MRNAGLHRVVVRCIIENPACGADDELLRGAFKLLTCFATRNAANQAQLKCIVRVVLRVEYNSRTMEIR